MFGSVYSIRKNPGSRAGFCSVAYTVYAKIQESGEAPAQQRIRKISELEQASVLQRIQYTQKSGSPSRLLPSSIRRIQESRQGLIHQRIRKNPGTRGGFCSVAYTVYVESWNPGRALSISVYAKIQELEQASALQRIRKIQELEQDSAQQRIPARISIHHKETGKRGSLTRFLMVRINADMKYYSVRSATTGSFLAALREGIMPEKSVSAILMRMRTTATEGGR